MAHLVEQTVAVKLEVYRKAVEHNLDASAHLRSVEEEEAVVVAKMLRFVFLRSVLPLDLGAPVPELNHNPRCLYHSVLLRQRMICGVWEMDVWESIVPHQVVRAQR